MKDLPPDPPLGFSARSMPLDREASWYSSPEARHIADVIVSFQTPAGGWGKNMNMSGVSRGLRGQSFVPDNSNRFPSPGDFDAARDPSWHYVGTMDNDATTTEMHFLAKVQASLPKRGRVKSTEPPSYAVCDISLPRNILMAAGHRYGRSKADITTRSRSMMMRSTTLRNC